LKSDGLKVGRPTSATVSTIDSSKFNVEAIPRSRVYSEVAKQLQDRIVQDMKPGDMLPSERELVQWFGVSRTSIRDAIRTLEAVGLLEPRQGIGTVVCDVSSEALAIPVASILLEKRKAISELLDVRMIIEPALANRAALHVSDEQIAQMESILVRQEEKLERNEPATEEDAAFHYTIALAADNGVMLKLVGVLMNYLRETRERSLQGAERQHRSLAGHRDILAALKRGDAADAEAAMRRHLTEVIRIILQRF